MTIDLREYLSLRHQKPLRRAKPGPVITISREFGCEANLIAQRLVKELNALGPKWSIISKEILQEAADTLNLAPHDLEQAFTPREKNYVHEMFQGFSTTMAIPDKRIYNIIRQVINNYAEKGQVIIVGRGGVAITREIEKSIHIRLMASKSYRAGIISRKRNISLKKARQIISSQDQRRRLFIQTLRGEIVDKTIFDLLLNRDTLSDQQILNVILTLGKDRKLF